MDVVFTVYTVFIYSNIVSERMSFNVDTLNTHTHRQTSHPINIKKPEAACKNEVTKLSRNGSFLGVCLDLK